MKISIFIQDDGHHLNKLRTVGSRPDSRVHFLWQSRKENEPKETAHLQWAWSITELPGFNRGRSKGMEWRLRSEGNRGAYGFGPLDPVRLLSRLSWKDLLSSKLTPVLRDFSLCSK